MLDIVDAISFAVLFVLGLIYIHGCDQLKGTRL
jgi:hypothetical protein